MVKSALILSLVYWQLASELVARFELGLIGVWGVTVHTRYWVLVLGISRSGLDERCEGAVGHNNNFKLLSLLQSNN